MQINKDRLWNQLHELGKIGLDKNGGVTRWPYTKEDILAKDWIKERMKEAKLDVYEDEIGNLIGVYNPSNSDLSPVITGSHYDTVISGGIFDGSLGVLGGIEVARTLHENNINLKRPLYIIGYKDEEGNRFEGGMIGSKSITNRLTEEDLYDKDSNGITVFEAMKQFGYLPTKYKKCIIDPIYAHVELHIEQGKVLEENNCSLGIVEGIPYIYSYDVIFKGTSGHAGATPMNSRNDPVVAMSEWIQNITYFARKFPNTVATIGKIDTFPGSPNVICNQVKLTLDIRSLQETNIESCIKKMKEYEKKWLHKNIDVEYKLNERLEGISCDKKIINQLSKIMDEEKENYIKLMSGAGHDSQNFKGICPVSMIFVKSIDGHSHRKEEYTTKEDCYKGVNTLMKIIIELCNE